MTRMVCAAVVAAVASVVAPDAAVAQTRESHWGVSASFVPRWQFPAPLADIWDMETDMRGSELRVGVVRGSDLGGDVGVSLVKKLVANGSNVFLRENACVEVRGQPACARGPYHVTRDAGMTGVEAHVFMPFATIRDRVQIGASVGGGIARIDGDADRFLEHLVVSGPSVSIVTDSLGRGSFKESLQDLPHDWKVIPIGRLDLGVSVIAAPGVKLRFTGGLNFPGYNLFGVHVQYLFQ